MSRPSLLCLMARLYAVLKAIRGPRIVLEVTDSGPVVIPADPRTATLGVESEARS